MAVGKNIKLERGEDFKKWGARKNIKFQKTLYTVTPLINIHKSPALRGGTKLVGTGLERSSEHRDFQLVIITHDEEFIEELSR